MATEIYIYDVIGEDFFGEGITDKDIRDELKNAGDEDVIVRINSPGGFVSHGTAIAQLLSEHKGRVDVQIDGIAASAASYIAISGETLAMANGAMMMIHDPWSLVAGNREDMRKEAQILDRFAQNYARAYAEKSAKTDQELAKLMLEETWFTAQEAVDFGLADTILPSPAAAYHVSEKFGYKKAPKDHQPPDNCPHNKAASVAAMQRWISLTKSRRPV